MSEQHTPNTFDPAENLPKDFRVNPFIVPEKYFETAAQSLSLSSLWHREREEAAWSVPPDYFAQLQDNIVSKLNEQSLKDMVVQSGFEVPDFYFDELSQRLNALHQIDQSTSFGGGFTIPDQYFNSSNVLIQKHAFSDQSIVRRFKLRHVAAYFAAACIATVFAIAALLNIPGDQDTNGRPLASVSDQEIISYLDIYGTESDVHFISEHINDFHTQHIGEGVSEDDIEEYLNQML